MRSALGEEVERVAAFVHPVDVAPDLDEVSPAAEELSEYGRFDVSCAHLGVLFRTVGIGALLLELDHDTFYHMLTRSALSRIFFLEHRHDVEPASPRFTKRSRTEGFFDALAAGRFDLAGRIDTLADASWQEGFEYPEDFYYAQYLGRLVQSAPADTQRAALDGLASALQGMAWTRETVCYALRDADADEFDEAFSALLAEREAEVEDERFSARRDDLRFPAEQHVFIEGLALLRLAERAGLPTRPGYPFCPPEARMPARAPFPNTLYPR